MKKILLAIIIILLPTTSFAQSAVKCPTPSKKQGNINQIFFSFSNKSANLGSYIPKNLVLIDKEYLKNGPRCLTKQTYEAFVSLNADLYQNTNQNLVIASAWRSLKTQQYFARTSPKFAAIVGRSEHQLGTTIDINIKDAKAGEYFLDTLAYKWMTENAHNYGFVQSFNDEGEEVTGIPNEPWHWRFVGKTLATKAKEENKNINLILQERKDKKAKIKQ
jgi:LAS superfamily LD-carboxypeptidase LdcB